MKYIKQWTQNHLLLVTAVSLAILVSLFGSFNLQFINFEILLTLAGLMLVLGLFTESGLLDQLTVKLVNDSKNTRQLAFRLIFLSFFASFFLSNDIAVLTLLPIYLNLIDQLPQFDGKYTTASLIAIAANIGGVFFPFSNPQNLIIYDQFSISFQEFVQLTLPIVILGVLLLLFSNILVEKKTISNIMSKQKMKSDLLPWSIAGMILILLAIFSLANIYIIFVIILVGICFLNFRYLKYIDFKLLLTFASFFMIVGNLNQITAFTEWIQQITSGPNQTYLLSIIFSQLLSNVPTTILISPFTFEIKAILWGVNLGGLGTLVASMANLLAYRTVQKSDKLQADQFLKNFIIMNFVFLLLMAISLWFFL